MAAILAPVLVIGGGLLAIWLAGADERAADRAAAQEAERTVDKLRRIPGVSDAFADGLAYDTCGQYEYSVEFAEDLDAAELTTAVDAVMAATGQHPTDPRATQLATLTMNDVKFDTGTPSSLVVGLAAASLVMGEADSRWSEISFASDRDFLARAHKALAALVHHRAVTPDHLRFESDRKRPG